MYLLVPAVRFSSSALTKLSLNALTVVMSVVALYYYLRILLVAYFLSVMVSLQANLEFLKYFTPFKYFDPALLLKTGRLDGTFLLLSAAIIVVCLAAAYWVYNRRDLYI